MPEIVQEIGAAAGLAAVAGLAVLSVLYFSQARDVKRLREWAGRAPERAAETTAPQVVPGRVQAQPQPKPGQPAAGQPGQPQPATAGQPGQPQPGKPQPVATPVTAQTAAAATAGAATAATGAAATATESDGDGAEPGKAQPGQPAQPGKAQPGQPQPAKPGQPQPAQGTPQPGAPKPGETPVGAPSGAPTPQTADGDSESDAAASPAGAPRPAAPALPATAGARAVAATQTKPAQTQPAPTGGNAQPAAPTGPGGPATPAGGRPPGAPPVPPGVTRRSPARPMLPPRPMPQQTAIIPPPRRPWYRRLLGSPRYLVLAVAGILILGGAGVWGITQLSSDDEGGGAPARSPDSAPATGGGDAEGENGQQRRKPVVPANVTVAVLNGTTVPLLAKGVGDQVESHGFTLGTVANTADQEQQRAESVVMFAPGHRNEAIAVSRRLKITQRQPIDPASQELAGDATVVVIAGADLAQ